MKKLIIALLTLFSVGGFAQQKSFGDKFSVEMGYGYTLPLGEVTYGDIEDYADFKNFGLGFNYNISDNWGIKLGYNFSEYQNKNVDYLGSTYHRITLGGNYDVYGAFFDKETPFKKYKNFDGLVNLGVGLALSQPDNDQSVTDAGLTFHAGIQPKFHLTNQLSVFLDVAYVMNMQRNYAFDGMPIIDGDKTSSVNALIGLSYRFGDN